MTRLRLTLLSGQSIFDQIVFAAKRALINREYLPGEAFPSVRALAGEFEVHPNTAHKVIQYLINERFLQVRPGVGTIVAALPSPRSGDKELILRQEVQRLVVEAKQVGLKMEEVTDAIRSQWTILNRSPEAAVNDPIRRRIRKSLP